MRRYLTGSLWREYEKGVRRIYGHELPDGLERDQRFEEALITPTTKAELGEHDEPLSPNEVVSRGLIEAGLWKQVEAAARDLFSRGETEAREHDLILVDTKYEFGLIDGRPALIDEVHTPDSSRFWGAESYEATRGADQEPENFDKEFLRIWFAERGYRGDGVPPAMPADFIAQVAQRYIAAYERLTGQTFVPGAQQAAERIAASLDAMTHKG